MEQLGKCEDETGLQGAGIETTMAKVVKYNMDCRKYPTLEQSLP